MGIHFITILGTSLYTNCTYEIESADFAYNTSFVQIAVLKYIMSTNKSCNRITVFVTEKSEERNWYTREYTEDERLILAKKQLDPKPGEKKIGLKDIMEKEFPDTFVERIRIREGCNKEEIDEIFESMYGAIIPDETIYFDFTHGLRNIPMQALTVIHYAKILKNIQVGGIYYGAFELGKRGEDGLFHVNLLDMSVCSVVLDWTNAAESFIKGGSSNQLKKLYEERVKPGREQRFSRKALERLCDLTNCLNTSRGKAGGHPQNSIQKAYEYFKSNYNELRKDENRVSERPLLRIFDKIEENVKIFERNYFMVKNGRKVCLENTSIGMAAVEWAICKNLTQQGFTALEETIKTYICELYEIPAEEELVRENIAGSTVKFMAIQYYDARMKQKDLPEAERKLPDKHILKQGRRKELERDSQFMKLEDHEQEVYIQKIEDMIEYLPAKLVNLSSDVSKFRNTLNHFGFQKDVISYSTLQNKLHESYEKMKKIMEEERIMCE